ncbi:MAG: glycosyltransferase family 2 protein, partial [Actinomycetota bacterium]|nr:glycosyltransferase family 2 protein [Actinomycetota bacterium]
MTISARRGATSDTLRPHLSVVIPTFNRSMALGETVRSVFASDLGDDIRVELIIIDDGSVEPATDALVDVQPPARWSQRVVRQGNQGVGAARNRGYEEAEGDVVVFVDDDMLLLADTLHRHLDAHHRRPGSVIFGRSPYVAQADDGPFVDWVQNLGNDPSGSATLDFVPARIVASGHLSVERTGPVSQWSHLYADDMRTPVAEEYELSHRLGTHQIPIYTARDTIALHNRKIDVDSFMGQQLGHGRGCAEVAHLHPECLELDELRTIIDQHGRRSAKQLLWVFFGTAPVRSMLRRAARAGQRGRLGRLAPFVFRLSAGAWF